LKVVLWPYADGLSELLSDTEVLAGITIRLVDEPLPVKLGSPD
jgi:hypothetical protein